MLNKQKIFLSGTDGVKDIINQLNNDLTSMGFDTVWFHNTDFPYFDTNAMDSCLEAVKSCDRFIFILDERAGLTHKKTGVTISEAEFNVAFSLKLPILVFVRDRVWNQSRIYHKKRIKFNRSLTQAEFINTDIDGDLETYEIIERLQHKKRDNKPCVPWITSFEFANKISKCIREKWLVSDEYQLSTIEKMSNLIGASSKNISTIEKQENKVIFSNQVIKKLQSYSQNDKQRLHSSLEKIRNSLKIGNANPLQIHKLVGSNLLSFRFNQNTRVLFKKENDGINIVDVLNHNA